MIGGLLQGKEVQIHLRGGIVTRKRRSLYEVELLFLASYKRSIVTRKSSSASFKRRIVTRKRRSALFNRRIVTRKSKFSFI